MDDPAEEDEPEDRREDELEDRHKEPALEQLPKPGDEETAESSDDVARRTLSSHEGNFLREPGRRNRQNLKLDEQMSVSVKRHQEWS